MNARRWKRADVTTEMLCWAIHLHGGGALDHLRSFLGIPPKVLVAAVCRDADRGWVTWGVTVWRPFLTTRGTIWVRGVLAMTQEEDAEMTTQREWSDMVRGALPPTTRPEPGVPAPARMEACCPECPETPREVRWHEAVVTTVELDGQRVARKIEGDAVWVAAALRALANQLDPPPPPAPPKVNHR